MCVCVSVCARYRGNVVTKCEIYDPEARSQTILIETSIHLALMVSGVGGGSQFYTLSKIRGFFMGGGGRVQRGWD